MSLFAIRHKPSGNLLNYRIEYVHEGYPKWCTLVNYNTWDEDYSSDPEGIWTTQNVESAKHVIKYPKSGDSKSDPCIDKKINVEDLEVVELIIGNVI